MFPRRIVAQLLGVGSFDVAVPYARQRSAALRIVPGPLDKRRQRAAGIVHLLTGARNVHGTTDR